MVPYIGLMSGTSLDGVDAVLAAFEEQDAPPRVLAATHRPFEPSLRGELLALQSSGPDELHRAALAAHALADLYATVSLEACRLAGVEPADVAAIGAHGQTVRHRPELGFTLQLNAPARLAERSGMTVVADFRSRDVAAGGQGAPLVPAFHARLFRRDGTHRIVVNLGGISNLTDLPAEMLASVRGWDCGPGNVLLDGWVARHRGSAYDDNGAWASSGSVRRDVLDALQTEPWFALAPPRSTGRDLFGASWLDARLDRFATIDPADVQATLAELTASAIVDSALSHVGCPDEVIVCGGGARNGDLMARLRTGFAAEGREVPVLPCSDPSVGGYAPEHIEALAFAWLARQCLEGRPGNLPEVTGAAGLRVLGAIHPR